MTTVTGFTAARMLEIEAASVVDGEIVGDDLILTKFDASTINAGDVRGPQGDTGAAGLPAFAIPGQVIMWPCAALPDEMMYGLWAWADGASYLIADHPIAAAHLGTTWDTFDGAADPGPTYFRVPDMRGLVPAGMDTMPGGAAAGRMVRSEADSVAGISGEETHVLTDAEMPNHNHGGSIDISGSTSSDGTHDGHANGGLAIDTPGTYTLTGSATAWNGGDFVDGGSHSHSFSGSDTIPAAGSDDPHENVQPTVFIPYIVALDG
jgi:microcystin-dependent protein